MRITIRIYEKLNQPKYSYLLQKVYEISCFIGTVLFIAEIKSSVANILVIILLLFLFLYISRNADVERIAFGITLTILSYCTWTVIITTYLTDFLYDRFIKSEHSIWDPLAFLIPTILTIWTLLWSLRRRKTETKFEVIYLSCLVVAVLIVINMK